MAQELDNKLDVAVRTEFGKGAARRIRANDQIPAVLYGHGTEPQHLTLPGHKTMLLVRRSNALIELDIEGKAELALVKDVQRDPVRQIIEHVDLLIVKQGERVEVEVQIIAEGDTYPGTILLQDAQTVLVTAEATHIPDHIVHSVEGLEEGATVHATDLVLPEGTKLVDDESEIVIFTVAVPQAEEEPAEDEEATEEAAPEAAEADSEE